VRRGAAWLAGLGAALALSACGVPPSGVIQAGDGATGLVPAFSVNLYFVTGSSLAPFPRSTSRAPGIPTAVDLLFDGPAPADGTQAGTRLPQPATEPEVQVDGSGVIVHLPGIAAPLDQLALRQLVCTVSGVAAGTRIDPAGPAVPTRTAGPATPPLGTPPATAVPGGGNMTVLVTGTGWKRTGRTQDASCPGDA
jgi:hypothetical protein